MRITLDPALVGDRSELSAEEFQALLAGGQPIAAPPPTPVVPDWQTNESAFLARVDAFAKERNWLTYHTWKSANSAPGFPDLVMIRGSRLVVAELKVGNNRTTKDQRRWLAAFGECGIEAYEWRPEDWDAIVDALK